MASAGHQLWSMIKIIWFSKSSPLHECSALGLADIVPLVPWFSKFCSFIMLNCACLWFITREKTLLNLNPQFFAYIYYLTCNHLYDENAHIGCGSRKPSSDVCCWADIWCWWEEDETRFGVSSFKSNNRTSWLKWVISRYLLIKLRCTISFSA